MNRSLADHFAGKPGRTDHMFAAIDAELAEPHTGWMQAFQINPNAWRCFDAEERAKVAPLLHKRFVVEAEENFS